MYIDPDKIKGQQTIEALQSAMADLTGHIENVEESLAVALDPEEARDDRADARETAAQILDELFTEFEALQRICEERLS